MNRLDIIRNFSIIAHIDHGKTTLTDRFLEITATVEKRLMHDRFLDSHPISQERGVTIKLAPVRMAYATDSGVCILDLIDTPGHIDFSYEVSRSLACCEGAVLLVDACQGVQAQTLANFRLAKKLGLKIIPVVNKIDLVNARLEKTAAEMVHYFDFNKEEIIFVSAKTGENVKQVLEAVVNRIPAPQENQDKSLRALVFDSFYHPHKGVIVYLKLVDGELVENRDRLEPLQFFASGTQFTPLEIGHLCPQMRRVGQLRNGEIGYLATGLKDIRVAKVGDTLVKFKIKNAKCKIKPLLGYQEPKPVVFFDFYPAENQEFSSLEQAVQQLKLNDFSLFFNLTSSPILGKGVRLGFLGLFHAAITQERLERDFNLSIISTNPSVEHQIVSKDGAVKIIDNAAGLPDWPLIKEIREPWIKLIIFTPLRFLGGVFRLCRQARAKLERQQFYGEYANLEYEMPLIELIEGFYDRLKSASSGFASLDYQRLGFRPFTAVKMDVWINKQRINCLSMIIEKGKAEKKARSLAKKLKEIIPPHLFGIPIQISLNNKIIARETIKALRKDVTAKLYGGDQTRKDKLLEKQKKGKRRLRKIGQVIIPQEAFRAALDID